METELMKFGVPFVAAFGAVVGSFLNVVIHRLPRGLSLVKPPSACPGCGARIRAYHNVPVLGYLVLRGRCRDCGVKISPRYPLVEVLMAALAVALWWRLGPVASYPVYFVFLAGLVAITFIDLDHKIIPDSMSLGGVVVGWVASLFTPVGWASSGLGIVAGGGALLAVAFGYRAVTGREGMGMGDVKLLAAIGAFLGWPAVPFTIFVSSIVGSVVGVTAMIVRGRDAKFEIPFGPFLALGAASYLFAGRELIRWYLGRLW